MKRRSPLASTCYQFKSGRRFFNPAFLGTGLCSQPGRFWKLETVAAGENRLSFFLPWGGWTWLRCRAAWTLNLPLCCAWTFKTGQLPGPESRRDGGWDAEHPPPPGCGV